MKHINEDTKLNINIAQETELKQTYRWRQRDCGQGIRTHGLTGTVGWNGGNSNVCDILKYNIWNPVRTVQTVSASPLQRQKPEVAVDSGNMKCMNTVVGKYVEHVVYIVTTVPDSTNLSARLSQSGLCPHTDPPDTLSSTWPTEAKHAFYRWCSPLPFLSPLVLLSCTHSVHFILRYISFLNTDVIWRIAVIDVSKRWPTSIFKMA